jgi:hypothetical protein
VLASHIIPISLPPPNPRVCAQVFNVPGRCFPVDIIHSQDDHMQDYAAAAIDTALQIHLNQPEGKTHRRHTLSTHSAQPGVPVPAGWGILSAMLTAADILVWVVVGCD